jgi:uncharacterized protein YkwD
MAQAVVADPVAVINGVRAQGCAGQAATGAPVQREKELDEVARELRRRELSEAMELLQYPAGSSTSFHVRGSREDQAIRQVLVDRYCDSVIDSRYSKMGMFQRGDETWIVLASRLTTLPRIGDLPAVARRVLELVNAARSEARTCGPDRFDAAPPVTFSAALTDIALLHSVDMATRGSLGHQGSDGSFSAERITRAGYQWQFSGENVASGLRDADTVVAGWVASPGHCATLMGAQFTEMGVAFALAPSSDPPIYWTQLFATPLTSPPAPPP